MELKATTLGKRMAQHPYDRVQLLNAGVKVSGDRHEYLIPFNQLLSVHCKRGLVWGELEFVLPDSKVVRLHGTEWSETQRFYHHLQTLWEQWSAEMSDIAAGVLKRQLATIERTRAEGKWLTRQQVADVQDNIRQALTGLPMPTSRLEAFDNCRELWRECQRWLGDIEATRLAHNQAFTEAMLEQYRGFFDGVESSPLNASQARAVVNGERSLLVLAGAGSAKPRCWWRGQAGCWRGEKRRQSKFCCWHSAARRRRRWMRGSASVLHPTISPRVPSTRWRYILFSRAAKKSPPSVNWKAIAQLVRRCS
jgi:DNA helicase-4